MADDEITPTRDDDGKPEWNLAGYTDWAGDYHEAPDGGFTTVDFDDMDMVTISWIDAENGSLQYANLVGPWEDWDELADVVDTYFEEGTP